MRECNMKMQTKVHAIMVSLSFVMLVHSLY